MNTIIDFSSSPLGHALLAYLALGICTLVFKPRTAAEYAESAARNPVWIWSRVTALWQLVGAIGLDPAKMADGLGKLITGKSAPLAIGLVAARDSERSHVIVGKGGPSSSKGEVYDSDDEPTLKSVVPYIPTRAASVLVACIAMTLSGCTPGAQAEAKTIVSEVLSVSAIACIFASQLTDSPAVMQACAIDSRFAPLVQQLIAQREGAKKAGVTWSADAGAP